MGKWIEQRVQMCTKYMKNCSTFLAIKEIQIKTTLRFHFTPVRLEIIKKTTNAGEDGGGERNTHLLLVGMQIGIPIM
jgi:hypothetical protein